MFTGIVEEVGKVLEIIKVSGGIKLKVRADKITDDTRIGDSIMVNGTCLTAIKIDEGSISFDISGETALKTNLIEIKTGDPVNLERALKASDSLGGHFVTGHIDGTARITSFSKKSGTIMLKIDISGLDSRLVVDKGSIAIDGISLTVAAIRENMVEIAIIPYTLTQTNLNKRKPGDKVNIELDIFAKYAMKALGVESNNTEARLINLLDNF